MVQLVDDQMAPCNYLQRQEKVEEKKGKISYLFLLVFLDGCRFVLVRNHPLMLYPIEPLSHGGPSSYLCATTLKLWANQNFFR